MYDISEQLRAAHKANLDIFLQFAGIAAAGAEKLVDLELKAAKSVFTDAVKNVKALSAAKDAQEFSEIQNSLVQPAVDNFTAYARDVYAVVTESQVELNKLIEERVADLNKNVLPLLDATLERAPVGSDVAAAVMKSAIIAANQAYGAFARTTKQVTEATVAAAGVAASKNKNNGGSRNTSA